MSTMIETVKRLTDVKDRQRERNRTETYQERRRERNMSERKIKDRQNIIERES